VRSPIESVLTVLIMMTEVCHTDAWSPSAGF